MTLVDDAYDDDEEEEDEVPGAEQIRLECGRFAVNICSWEELRDQHMQGDALLTPETFADEAGEQEVFAFCYKNEVVDPWSHIFVVRDGPNVHLFDLDGVDIEDDDSAPNGRQPLVVDGASTGFLEEWTHGFYSNAVADLTAAAAEVVPQESGAPLCTCAVPSLPLPLPALPQHPARLLVRRR